MTSQAPSVKPPPPHVLRCGNTILTTEHQDIIDIIVDADKCSLIRPSYDGRPWRDLFNVVVEEGR